MPDTTTHDRPFIPLAHELPAMLKNRTGVFWRPVVPQPTRELAPIEIAELCSGLRLGRIRCPFGVPGDRLYLAEPWAVRGSSNDRTSDAGIAANPSHYQIWTRTRCFDGDAERFNTDFLGRWRPAETMPRCVSVLTLEVVSVRVQRVQEISEADAIDAGAMNVDVDLVRPGHRRAREDARVANAKPPLGPSPLERMQYLWNSHYAAQGLGWDANKPAWGVEWRKVDA